MRPIRVETHVLPTADKNSSCILGATEYGAKECAFCDHHARGAICDARRPSGADENTAGAQTRAAERLAHARRGAASEGAHLGTQSRVHLMGARRRGAQYEQNLKDEQEKMSFVDTRLHIAVRPYLEYVIPELSLVVRDTLLGDVSAKETLQRLGSMKRAVPEDEYGSGGAHTPPLEELSAHCTRVLTHAVDHVKHMETMWVDFLTRVANGVRHEMRSIQYDMAAAKDVHRRYKQKKPDVVEAAYRREMLALQRRLDECLHTYRVADAPVCERPEALRVASDGLREAFANAYGEHSTRDLVRLKMSFEAQLLALQSDTADSFVGRVCALLERA